MQSFGPYSPLRRAGNTYFVAGQVGVNPQTKQASKLITEQTTQALLNLKIILEREGLSLQDVVKTTVFLVHMDDFGAMNEAYLSAFDAPRPARSTVAVDELPRVAGKTQLLVEIEAVAYKEQL